MHDDERDHWSPHDDLAPAATVYGIALLIAVFAVFGIAKVTTSNLDWVVYSLLAAGAISICASIYLVWRER